MKTENILFRGQVSWGLLFELIIDSRCPIMVEFVEIGVFSCIFRLQYKECFITLERKIGAKRSKGRCCYW